ncbi:MAG: XRE family transcriptional regulator [Pseudonocardiales bacterium]|nr:XRE family transcriptional regulator [Pseudonocardiales bacterium]MBV9727918.1 XRE family transcriptional regulator [Pseudonocardiales bacterium]
MIGPGEALLVARKAQGLTQDDVCGQLGITQATLSRYENDQRIPDDETLANFAKIYGVTVSFLRYGQRTQGALAIDSHMRRQKTTKATLWRRLEARLTMYRLHISLLFEEVSIRSTNIIPTFDPEGTQPATAALITRAQWKMPAGPVLHLIRWLEAAGCVVIEEDFGTIRIDGLSQWIGDHPVILINSRLPTDRKRLTLAHELGHLCLHSSLATANMEEEANAFAAEFLMPEHVIRSELRNLTLGKLIDLKREWGVSMQAIFERAYRLGFVKSSDRVDFYKALNSRGWKVCEPASDELPIERAELAQEIGARMRERGLGDDEIAGMAGFATGAKANPFLIQPKRLHAV